MHLKKDILLFTVLGFIIEEEIWKIKLRGYPMKIDIKHFHVIYLCIFIWQQQVSAVSVNLVLGAMESGYLLSNPVIGFGFSLTKLSDSGWVLLWKHFSLKEKGLCNFLARNLLFFMPHPLPQLLTDISQRVCFDGEHLYCLAEPDSLHFTAIKGKTQQTSEVTAKHGACLHNQTAEKKELENLLTGVCVSVTVSSDWSLLAQFSSLAWREETGQRWWRFISTCATY